MLGQTMVIERASCPGSGEDSFAVSSLPGNVMLCVADGCGGLGSRRYDGHTGAYLASRLAVRTLLGWVEKDPPVPQTPQEGAQQLTELQRELASAFAEYAHAHCHQEGSGRIVGSMQRQLPTTLCALMADEDSTSCCFVWAGDSRGYLLDDTGLHQYTQDDAQGNLDALESLLLDRPLSNFISADKPFGLHMRRFALPKQGLLLCATDGVYSPIASPMELEQLLLDTLVHSVDQESWQHRLDRALANLMQDDMTLLCCPVGFDSYRAMKEYYKPRYDALRRDEPPLLRRKRTDRVAIRERWQRYRLDYDRTEGRLDDQQDWRI